MIALVILLVRLMITCVIMAVRLSCWMLKLMIMWTATLVTLIGHSSAGRRSSAAMRRAR